MDDEKKSKSELLSDLSELRLRVAALEAEEADHRKTKEKLHESQRMLQLVLDTIPQRVFWKDHNFVYLGCNKAFAKDAGVDDPDLIVGKNDFELGWKEVAHIYRDDDAAVMKSGRPKLNFEEPQSKPDGGRLWLQTSKVPLHDREGKVIGVLGTYADITDRKQVEESIQRERSLLRILVDNLPDPIYFKNSKGEYILNNRAHLKSMGMERQEDVLGKTTFDFHPREMAESYHADEMEIIQSGKALLGREEI